MSVYDSQSEKPSMKRDQMDIEQCCSSKPIYEITYNHISRKWLICNECVELDFFKNGIKEKVKISK